MSTTTNFKRIALVAVAALGLGVLSSVPSQATINADTLTLSTTAVAQNTAETKTASSAIVTVQFFGTSVGDSMSITTALTGAPSGNVALPTLELIDTSSAIVETNTTTGAALEVGNQKGANTAVSVKAGSNTVTTKARFYVYLTSNGSTTAPTVAGTYTVKITPATVASGALQGSAAVTLTITVAAAPSLDTNASAATSVSYINTGGSGAISADSVVVKSKAAGTYAGYVYILQKNAAGVAAAAESVTATIAGAGQLGRGSVAGAIGRSITLKYDDTVTVYADGTSGVGTITVTGQTSGALLSTKSATFYGAPTAFKGTLATSILAVGANALAISVGATDAAGTKVGALSAALVEEIYAFSSDTSIATVPATALSYSTDSATATITGVKAGNATVTFGNASTLAASTIKSTPVAIRVGSTSIATVTAAFDKATYVPGEKATITVTVKDSTGQFVVPGTYELWAGTYGLTSAKSFSQGTGPASTETAVATSATTFVKTYTVYMPVTAGAVTVSGTLAKTADVDYAPVGVLKTAAAIQGTVVTATATVSDSGSAALAAVTALATTVASLKTLITTLTNLVLKIQKKVKA